MEQVNSLLASKADTSITVNGQPLSANVSLTQTDIGLEKVDNTSDVNKPVSTATSAALAMKANKATTLGGYGITDAATNSNVVHNLEMRLLKALKHSVEKLGSGQPHPAITSCRLKE